VTARVLLFRLLVATALTLVIAGVSPVEACDPNESCNRCLVSAFGRCVQSGNDAICEARKKACQAVPPVFNTPGSPFGPGSALQGGPNSEIRRPFPFPDGTPNPPSPTRLVPVRGYMRAGDIPPPWVAAYGVVAFRAKSTDTNRSRLLRVCQSFKAYLPRQESIPASVSLNEQMITIWPLDDPSAAEAQKDDCEFAIDHYDLYGGISAIQDAQSQTGTIDGRGPFLIGWSPSSARGVPDKVVLIVDLSSFDSQSSFDEMFLFWQKKVIENPDLWRSGFAVEHLRLAIRDFVDLYGSDILSAIKLTSR
jgi:hypothetical protein